VKGKQGTFPIENERGSDHSIVRQGLKQIVSECPGMVVAGEAASGQEVLDLVRKSDFDVAIVDIAMPGRGGLEILRELKAEKPSMKLMVLSMYAEEQYAIGADSAIPSTSRLKQLFQLASHEPLSSQRFHPFHDGACDPNPESPGPLQFRQCAKQL